VKVLRVVRALVVVLPVGFGAALLAFVLGVLTLWGHSTVTPENVNHAPLLLPVEIGWALIVGGLVVMVVVTRTLMVTVGSWRHATPRRSGDGTS